MTGAADLQGRLAKLIRDVPDFPTPGIVFKDITPLLADASAFAAAVEEICRPHRSPVPDKVAGIEARGFILGAPVAQALGVGFVPVRKKCKLPGDVVLATGGTAAATIDLVRRCGAEVVGVSVLIELTFLPGRAALSAVGAPEAQALLQY